MGKIAEWSECDYVDATRKAQGSIRCWVESSNAMKAETHCLRPNNGWNLTTTTTTNVVLALLDNLADDGSGNIMS